MNKYLLVIIFLIIAFLGCKQELCGRDFEKILADSEKNSAVSYWYVGEKDGYHYIQERWPLPNKSKLYRISQNQLQVLKNLEFTEDQSKWMNLKKDDVLILSK